MGSQLPAYLFVVRHGNRLDAADKKWHLTSPTPYDPPLTYGGFLQARQVGNQIGKLLEQAKLDSQQPPRNGASSPFSPPSPRPRRFKVVIHSLPFLRCVQTSIGISLGLAQTSPDSVFCPSDIIVPRAAPSARPLRFKSALLRLDSFLGEWLSHEYFDMITPPPGPALMMGGAKADLLRREDYSAYADPLPHESSPSPAALWQAEPPSGPANGAQSPTGDAVGDAGGPINPAALASALPARPAEPEGYVAPRPLYAVSSTGKILEGFVAHARDACVTVDFQWDSMRDPLDFGGGGKLGEEWAAMHKRFRGGLRKLVNWYATTDAAADLMATKPAAKPAKAGDASGPEVEGQDEHVETVVVSHGAGCNALIGAITHQPVLMDVGMASITMATRKPNLDYAQMLAAAPPPADPAAKPHVQMDDMYDLRLSASTEHFQSTSSTPASSRSASTTNIWQPANHGTRGRTSTLSSTGGPVLSPLTYFDPLSSPGSRSTSASAAVGASFRHDSGSHRPLPRGPAVATTGLAGISVPGSPFPSAALSYGLWSPVPSALRLMDDGSDDPDDFGSMLPNFDQARFNGAANTDREKKPSPTRALPSAPAADGTTRASEAEDRPAPRNPPEGPVLAAPIKLHTNLGPDKPIEEVTMSQLGGGLGGLWGLPPPLDEAEHFRDLSHTKRRWTVNERA